MSDKFKYIEYEKLSDAVRDLMGGTPLFVNFGTHFEVLEGHLIDIEETYYKRVEVKEKTIEAWVAINPEGLLLEASFSEIEILDSYKMKVDRYNYKIVKLTGIIKE